MTAVVAVAGGLLGLCGSLVLFGGLLALRKGVGLITWFLIIAIVCALSATLGIQMVTVHWAELVIVGGIGSLGGVLVGIGYRFFNPFRNRLR